MTYDPQMQEVMARAMEATALGLDAGAAGVRQVIVEAQERYRDLGDQQAYDVVSLLLAEVDEEFPSLAPPAHEGGGDG